MNSLQADAISKAYYKSKQTPLEVSVFDSLASTNSWLLERPVEPGTARLVLTEDQKEGRGRRGNAWKSAPNRNIMMSAGWCFKTWPEQLSGLSLVVGMLVAEQLNRHFELDVKVKWPNDLMIQGRKLGGILIELSGNRSGHCQVVLGLGLNVHQPDWSESSSEYAWQDLAGLGISLDRNEFVGCLMSEMVSALEAFEVQGFAPLVPAWQEYSSYHDMEVVVIDQGAQTRGKMSGVDESGALLLVDSSGQEHRFLNSNVSVRLVQQEGV